MTKCSQTLITTPNYRFNSKKIKLTTPKNTTKIFWIRFWTNLHVRLATSFYFSLVSKINFWAQFFEFIFFLFNEQKRDLTRVIIDLAHLNPQYLWRGALLGALRLFTLWHSIFAKHMTQTRQLLDTQMWLLPTHHRPLGILLSQSRQMSLYENFSYIKPLHATKPLKYLSTWHT